MITRPAVIPMFAALLGLALVAVAQENPARATVRPPTGDSQLDSAGRAFLDDTTSLGPRSYLPSDFDPSSSTRTLEPLYCQMLVGAYFSGRPGPEIRAFNYLPATIRYGWELGGSGSETLMGIWRNTDFIVDVTGAKIISEYGSFFAGPTFQIRKNFANPGSAVIPYFQAGFGFVLNDAYRDENQRAVGHFFEFTEQAEVGVKWMLSPDLSLDATFGAQHISNANLSNRNLGVNAYGGQIGLTYYFFGGRSR